MARLPNKCPACQEQLEVTRLTCAGCATQLEGKFGLPELLRLEPDDQQFVLDFVRASGSLKQMGEQLKLSYPTVRNRLNDLIGKLDAPVSSAETERRRILDAIAKGELSVKEAAKRLKELA